MSNDERRPYDEALPIAQSLARTIYPYCEVLYIAGSLRRQKLTIGDIELVAIPSPNLLTFLDGMVIRGEASKAIYSNGTNRWGNSYRGLDYQGMKCEIFLADENNIGYQYWLRTGPGDANTYIMQYCSWKKAPYRAHNGYWWHGESKLAIRGEHELFEMLGIPYLEPQQRTQEVYKRWLEKKSHEWGACPALAEVQEIPQTVQLSMFEEPKKVRYD